jgi:molybdopterin-guanine dinucleotide biosynthesis protein A
VIVAGGNATRLGGVAKGLLDVGGLRIIDRVAAGMSPVTNEILIATNAPDASTWLPEVRIVNDILTGGGAAAGIHAALRATGGPILVVGWDMPFVVSPVLELIVERANTGRWDAVVPAGAPAAGLEPLCAWYSVAAADAIERRWAQGERSLHDLLTGIRTCIVPTEAMATIAPVERLFHNVNTPADLAAARAMAEQP